MSGSADYAAKKNEQILAGLLKEEANKYCADCGQKGISHHTNVIL